MQVCWTVRRVCSFFSPGWFLCVFFSILLAAKKREIVLSFVVSVWHHEFDSLSLREIYDRLRERDRDRDFDFGALLELVLI